MRIVMLTLFFCFSLCVPALAAEDYGLGDVEAAIPQSAREVLGDLDGGSLSVDNIFSRVWSYAREHIKDEAAQVLRPVAAVVAIALLCSVAESGGLAKDINYVNLGGCLAIAAVAVGDVQSVVQLGERAMEDMSDFSRVLLPTLSTVAAGAGAISSAGAKYAAAALFLDVLIAISDNLILPLVGAYTAALVAASAIGDGRLKAAVKFLKWLCKACLTALVTVFTAYISLTGIAATGADAAATKTAKAVITTALPIVGKIVSDAGESLVAGAGLIRNTVGILGLGAVVAICAAPFLALGLRYLLFKAAAAVVSAVAGDRVGSLVEGISTAYGMVLALVGTGAIFMFISILSLIRTVT